MPYYEGVAALGTLFTWTCPVDITVTHTRMTVRTPPSGASLIAVLQQNGTTVNTMTILSGASDSGYSSVSLPFVGGDTLSVVITSVGTTVEGGGIQLTIDMTATDISPSSGIYYADPDADIIKYLRQVGIGDKLADSLATTDLTRYKAAVNDLMDSQLMPVYRTPLHTVTRGARTYFPEPIQFIAIRWVAALLLNDIYSEVEPNTTGNVERQQKLAMEQLESVANRRVLLRGQRYRARAYGSNPHTELVQPPTGGISVPGVTPPPQPT
jgi:hypothetical protein